MRCCSGGDGGVGEVAGVGVDALGDAGIGLNGCLRAVVSEAKDVGEGGVGEGVGLVWGDGAVVGLGAVVNVLEFEVAAWF